MNKKYLIYNNLVRGSGLGHFFLSYNYGLDYSIKNNLEYLPALSRLGHGLGYTQGLVEEYLGLPICEEKRKEVLKNEFDLCEIVEYTNNNPVFGLFGSTLHLYRDWYFNKSKKVPVFIENNKFNIAASIRRGDLMSNLEGHKYRIWGSSDHYFRSVINKNIPDHDNYSIHIFSDGDGTSDNYIDDKGNSRSFEEMCDILNIPKDKTKYHTSYSKKNSDTSVRLLFSTIKSCVLSDVFVGSYSSFSSVITLYRDKKSILPKNFGGFQQLNNIFYENPAQK